MFTSPPPKKLTNENLNFPPKLTHVGTINFEIMVPLTLIEYPLPSRIFKCTINWDICGDQRGVEEQNQSSSSSEQSHFVLKQKQQRKLLQKK